MVKRRVDFIMKKPQESQIYLFVTAAIWGISKITHTVCSMKSDNGCSWYDRGRRIIDQLFIKTMWICLAAL